MTRAVAILAGGESRRMGTDKAKLAIDGETLLDRTARAALASHAETEVWIVGRARTETESPRLHARLDREAGGGPLFAVAATLEEVPSFIACACDMPNLTPDTFAWLFARGEENRAGDGIAVHHGSQVEPLFSIYRRSCLRSATALLARGERSLKALVAACSFVHLEAPPAIARALLNVNTPGDWREWHERHERHERHEHDEDETLSA